MQQEAQQIPRVEIELDIQLKEDVSGELKTELLSKLDEEYKTVKTILTKGCQPSDYPLYQGLLGAIETAKSVITDVWEQLHKTKRAGL